MQLVCDVCGFRFSGAFVGDHVHSVNNIVAIGAGRSEPSERNGLLGKIANFGLVMSYPNIREVLMCVISEKYDSLEREYFKILAKYDLPNDLLPKLSTDHPLNAHCPTKIELMSGKRTILFVLFSLQSV